jgi:hypothetical protein
MFMAVAYPPVIFSEILDFLMTSPSLQEIIDFKPSQELEERLTYLLVQISVMVSVRMNILN